MVRESLWRTALLLSGNFLPYISCHWQADCAQVASQEKPYHFCKSKSKKQMLVINARPSLLLPSVPRRPLERGTAKTQRYTSGRETNIHIRNIEERSQIVALMMVWRRYRCDPKQIFRIPPTNFKPLNQNNKFHVCPPCFLPYTKCSHR